MTVKEKSLPEETKKDSRCYLGETLWNDKNVVAIILIRMNLMNEFPVIGSLC